MTDSNIKENKVNIGQTIEQRYGEPATVKSVDDSGLLSVCFNDGNAYEQVKPDDFLMGRLLNSRRFVGMEFGHLRIKEVVSVNRLAKNPTFLIRCSCGNEFTSGIGALLDGHGRKSCGKCDCYSDKMNESIETRRDKYRKEIIGKKYQGLDGGFITIIDAFDGKHIRVENERGFSWNADYGHIKGGRFLSSPKEERVLFRKGLKNMQRCGYVAEIVEVIDNRNVRCSFDDGSVLLDAVLYKDFIAGKVEHPDGKTKETKAYRGPFVGESKLSNAGEMMTITKLSDKCHVIDICFDDGPIRSGIAYESFLTGRVLKPEGDKVGRTSHKTVAAKEAMEGKVFTTNQGFKVKVIEYVNSHHVLVRFLDDGSEKYAYAGDIRRGEVSHPSYGRMRKAERIGESYIQKNGLRLTIVGSGKVSSCRAAFDDGVEIEAKYSSIVNGTVRHPKENEALKIESRIGETSVAANGQKMTIIAATDKRNVTVRFEDGTIVDRRSYQMFKEGHIENPNRTCRMIEWEKQIGKEIRSKNGLFMKVLRDSEEQANGTHSFDLESADGFIIRNQSSCDVKKGEVCHPAFSIQKTPSDKRIFCGYKIVSRAFAAGSGDMFYNVISEKGDCLVMSPQMMLAQAYIKGMALPDWGIKYFEKELKNIRAVEEKVAETSAV